MLARQVTLDGTINGSATCGTYQNQASNPIDAYGNQTASGIAAPLGGTLTIGKPPSYLNDMWTDQIILAANTVPLGSAFGPEDQPYDPNVRRPTILSAKILNDAGLGNIQLYTNSTFTTESGAKLTMPPGGSFAAAARKIVHNGEINVPSGTVTMESWDSITSNPDNTSGPTSYVQLDQKIYLETGSKIDVSGQKSTTVLPAPVCLRCRIPATSTVAWFPWRTSHITTTNRASS